MHSSLTFVAARCLGMMRRLFMLTGIVLFGCFLRDAWQRGCCVLMPSYDGRQLSSTLRFLSIECGLNSSGVSGASKVQRSSKSEVQRDPRSERRNFPGATSDQEEQKAPVGVAPMSLKPAGEFYANWNNYSHHSRSAFDRCSADMAYSAGWGPYPAGGLGLVLVVLLILVLLGRV